LLTLTICFYGIFANPQFTKDVAKAEFVHENAMRTTCSFTEGGPLFIETNRAKGNARDGNHLLIK
jgi:hypothetical protein